jgi:hypothetical protein
MALLDLQGMETKGHGGGGGGSSEVSLLVCGHSNLSVTLCTP